MFKLTATVSFGDFIKPKKVLDIETFLGTDYVGGVGVLGLSNRDFIQSEVVVDVS